MCRLYRNTKYHANVRNLELLLYPIWIRQNDLRISLNESLKSHIIINIPQIILIFLSLNNFDLSGNYNI